MAGGMDLGTGGGKGKKPLDATINLVPFIDLMAVLISFLLMTAVWSQLGRLQVSSTGQNNGEETPPDPNQVNITLLLTEKELKLTVGATAADPIPITRDKERIDLGALTAKLKEVKGQMPDKSNLTLQIEDKVRYEDVVRVIDGCIGADFPAVSVTAAS
jgi:biopolymer transport protein TolR